MCDQQEAFGDWGSALRAYESMSYAGFTTVFYIAQVELHIVGAHHSVMTLNCLRIRDTNFILRCDWANLPDHAFIQSGELMASR